MMEQARKVQQGITWLWMIYMLSSLCFLGPLMLGSLMKLSTPWYIVQGVGVLGFLIFLFGRSTLWDIFKKKSQLATRILVAFNGQHTFAWVFWAALTTQFAIIVAAQTVTLPASFAAYLTVLVITLTMGVASLHFNRAD